MKTIARIIYWRYKRGSWQYDILCALILGFIFLTPREVFDGTYFTSNQPTELQKQDEAEDQVLKDKERKSPHLAREPVSSRQKGR
ncbi:MAG TPA: hypothetical protein VKZ59_07325 [Acidobacteriota bacterium]|nr:hypothetical protein [Acidobacteriota bacterium]